MRYAGFWIRFWAAVVDLLVLAPPLVLVLFFIILLTLKSLVYSQSVGITGWVFDYSSLEKISGAIVLDAKSNFYSETTEQGYYQLVSKKGKREIVFAAPGYKTQKIVLDLTGSIVKNVFPL